MSYSSQAGRRPDEYASKSSHSNIIRDEKVKKFLDQCSLPNPPSDLNLREENLNAGVDYDLNSPINHIITIDGGYTEVTVQKEYPSSTLCYFQFGALYFERKDLENLSNKPFIDPEDMESLKNIERLKFVLPTKNISYKEGSLTNSIRNSFYDFFTEKEEKFIETLKWFLFREFDSKKKSDSYTLSSCPNPKCDNKLIEIKIESLSEDYCLYCNKCGEKIYLTDVFRLHELIDDELGASGILGYVTNTLEHLLLIHYIKVILEIKPSLLKETLFIKDGPLAFFSVTANMHKPMRDLSNYLFEKYNLNLVGIEKSGSFAEHAAQIKNNIDPGTILLLNNDYIYKYIIPGRADPKNPYARTSYYGGKLIFKSRDDRLYVITVPVANEFVVLDPKKENFKNLDSILQNIEKLKCDMYDNSLFPVALANKLVSLSAHPSSVILEKFAKNSIK